MQYLVDEFEKSLPPMGHPLRKLGVRLTELLDDDHWAECERLLLEGWEHDAADRATGARWRANSSLEEWFPYTHEELARLRETLQGIADADWRRWEELATPDEFVRWAKSRAAHALRPNAAVKPRRPVEAAVRPELVTDLRMSRRSMNCLLAANIERIEQVTELSEIDLLRLPNIGKGSVLEISTALAIVGLSLRPGR